MSAPGEETVGAQVPLFPSLRPPLPRSTVFTPRSWRAGLHSTSFFFSGLFSRSDKELEERKIQALCINIAMVPDGTERFRAKHDASFSSAAYSGA